MIFEEETEKKYIKKVELEKIFNYLKKNKITITRDHNLSGHVKLTFEELFEERKNDDKNIEIRIMSIYNDDIDIKLNETQRRKKTINEYIELMKHCCIQEIENFKNNEDISLLSDFCLRENPLEIEWRISFCNCSHLNFAPFSIVKGCHFYTVAKYLIFRYDYKTGNWNLRSED